MKTLDMADKYEPLSYQDDEDTVRMQVPLFPNQVIVDADATDDEPTLPSMRNPFHQEEKRYPGIGLLIALGTGLAFWGTVAYLVLR